MRVQYAPLIPRPRESRGEKPHHPPRCLSRPASRLLATQPLDGGEPAPDQPRRDAPPAALAVAGQLVDLLVGNQLGALDVDRVRARDALRVDGGVVGPEEDDLEGLLDLVLHLVVGELVLVARLRQHPVQRHLALGDGVLGRVQQREGARQVALDVELERDGERRELVGVDRDLGEEASGHGVAEVRAGGDGGVAGRVGLDARVGLGLVRLGVVCLGLVRSRLVRRRLVCGGLVGSILVRPLLVATAGIGGATRVDGAAAAAAGAGAGRAIELVDDGVGIGTARRRRGAQVDARVRVAQGARLEQVRGRPTSAARAVEGGKAGARGEARALVDGPAAARGGPGGDGHAVNLLPDGPQPVDVGVVQHEEGIEPGVADRGKVVAARGVDVHGVVRLLERHDGVRGASRHAREGGGAGEGRVHLVLEVVARERRSSRRGAAADRPRRRQTRVDNLAELARGAARELERQERVRDGLGDDAAAARHVNADGRCRRAAGDVVVGSPVPVRRAELLGGGDVNAPDRGRILVGNLDCIADERLLERGDVGAMPGEETDVSVEAVTSSISTR